jgi:GGDEF domain-containing protein
VARKVRVGLHIGIAEFGVDAFSDAELYRAAETAMLLAKNTDRPIVTYSQVRSITDQPQPEAN